MLDIQAELHEAGQPYQDLYDAVVELKRRHDLHPCAVRPRDGLSLRGEAEREVVQDLMLRFRRLPEETRHKLPALWNSLAQLEVVVGDLEAGLTDFQEVARLVQDPISRAEAHHNVHRAALERRDWETALAALRRAVALDPETFEPFPFHRYEPIRILGAGGIGTSFLCKDHATAEQLVVIKTLRLDSLDREGHALLRDAKMLQDLDHPALVRILDTGFAGADPTRPFLVLEYIQGETLEQRVSRQGPLSPPDWLRVAWPLLRALQALHHRGLLHRGLHPGAILLGSYTTQQGEIKPLVKVLDAGLALKRTVIHACASHPEASRDIGLGRSVARLIPFAPPEIVARPKGHVWVGPHSDLYSFGRLTAFALTGKVDPDRGDQLLLDEGWQKILRSCTAWTIQNRPSHVGIVLDSLASTAPAEMLPTLEQELYHSTIEALSARLHAFPEDVEAYLQRGGVYLRQGELDQAAADYSQALRLRPEEAAYYRLRGQVYARAGKLDEALSDFSQALKLEPRSLEALAHRGLVYSQKGDHERALADYTEGLRLNPRDEILYYNRGNAHYSRGEYTRAIADYSEVLRLDSRHLWSLGNRGKAYLLQGDPGRAVADFTRLLQLDPKNVRVLGDRAVAYLELGRIDRALADYTQAITLEPSAALLHDRGLARLRQGDYEQALVDFTEALTHSPENAAVLLSRGKAYAEMQRQEEALADFTEALRIAPQATEALVYRAEILRRRKEYDQALQDLTSALQANPDPLVFFHRGNLLAEQGEVDRAIVDFTEVIRLNPRASKAYSCRGAAHARLGDLDRAVADLTQALEISPEDLGTLAQRASCLLQLGRYQESLTDFTLLLKLDPSQARAYTSRALLLAQQGNLTEALADLEVAIRLEPGYARNYHQRGNVHVELGALKQAISDFTEAIRLDPEYALAWYNRGVTHADLGNLAEALEDLTEAIRLAPQEVSALVNRALVHRRLGDLPAALADLTTALEIDPQFLLAYYNRANLYAENGEYRLALADLDYVLEHSPQDVGAWINRGRMHSLLGEHHQALQDNLAALSRAPDDPRVLNNLAWLYATAPQPELRNPARAVELARQAMAAGEDAMRLDTLAAAYASLGDFAQAVDCQQQALQLAEVQDKDDFRSRLLLYEQQKPYHQSLSRIDDGSQTKDA